MKQRKRKFNIIDFTVLVVIIALFAGAYMKINVINKKQPTALSETQKIELEFLIKEVRQPTVDAIKVGDTVFDVNTGVALGVVKEKSIDKSTNNILLTDGTYTVAEKPNRFDVNLIIESPVIEKTNGYFANGQVELKRQSTYTLKSKFYETFGKIINITN